MLSNDQLTALVEEICLHARQCFGQALHSVNLYGSYARGDADAESDVDVMILVNLPKEELETHRYDWNVFGTELDLQYGVLTSLKLQDTESFYHWMDAVPFYRNVAREGVRFVA